ncbi:hypothetical protein M1D80_07750 [Phyllobacteriaceae bacterium JZ32]
MLSKALAKLSLAAIAVSILQIYTTPSYSQSAADTPSPNPSETIQFPAMKVVGPGIHIKYHFTKAEKDTVDRNPSAEHFPNRIFRLNEENKVWYGFYAFEGNPTKDRKFTAYYLNAPRDEKDPVLYIRIDYDNKTHKFKEELITPDGKKVLQEGTFEIVTDKR